MRVLLGIDLVECARCALWSQYSQRVLLKIFSLHEIAYCMHEPRHAAARFAVRFAAREACYKALQPLQHTPIPFLLFARAVSVMSRNGVPHLQVNHDVLKGYYHLDEIDVLSLSLTHTPTTAAAVVVATARTGKDKL